MATSPFDTPSQERAALVALYEATEDWYHDIKLASDNPTGEWLRRHAPSPVASIVKLDLEGNWLHGPLPAETRPTHYLRTLDLGGKWFRGGIPPALGNLAMLELLDLSGGQHEV